MSTQNPSIAELGNLSFEQAMGELESLVRRLEEGRFSLEEAISAYERGVALKNHCEAKLRAAKLRVDQLVMNNDGTPSLEPLDVES